jgi:hypothetical protein
VVEVGVDTETTRVTVERAVWEIGMVRRVRGEPTRELALMVDLRGMNMLAEDQESLRIGRFWERHPYGRWLSGRDRVLNRDALTSPARAAELVAEWTRGAHLIGCQVHFDAEGLAALLARHGHTPGWDYHLVEVQSWALGWLAGRGRPMALPYSSHALSQACGVKPPADADRHTALGDARWALRWWDTMRVGAPETPDPAEGVEPVRAPYSDLEPSWRSLEAALPRDQWADWMWMGRVHHDGRVIEQYKHAVTRQYLNLDHEGGAWRVEYTDPDAEPEVRPVPSWMLRDAT